MRPDQFPGWQSHPSDVYGTIFGQISQIHDRSLPSQSLQCGVADVWGHPGSRTIPSWQATPWTARLSPGVLERPLARRVTQLSG
jgi:hypothetical protein